jgi:hypothetical protein
LKAQSAHALASVATAELVMFRSCLSACFACLLFAAAANAGESFAFYPYCHKPAWCFSRCGCPDDYCKKPLPCVSCDWRGTCDDYCKKPLPCVSCDWCGTCDDYCRKPAPIRIPTCLPPWFQCHSAQP